jgi:uncharacterized protein (TIGR02246 family)
MKKAIILCLAILLPVLIFLTAGTNQEKMLSQEDEKAIRNLIDAYEKGFLASDWNAQGEFYAEDSVQMPPNESVVVGKEAIQSRIESYEEITSFDYRERPIMIIEGRDDLAFTWSHYKGKGKYKGESFSNGAVMLTVFRKQQDGTWKIVCDIWSYDK